MKYVDCTFCFLNLPNPPTRDADTLDDADADLGHEDKKESHEVEGTVAPVKNRRIKKYLKCIKNHSSYISSRCRDLDVGFFLFPFQHFTFPNAHFGLHLSNNGAPQQQVFTHFLPRQCRHENTTESRITPCTQVFNLCASALQRTKIRKREEENDHSC